MNKDFLKQIKEAVKQSNFIIVKEQELSNGYGYQIRLNNEAIVCVYNTGKISLQGKNREPVLEALSKAGLINDNPTETPAFSNLRKVFVVYGHDKDARNQLEAMLRRWGLEPLILEQLPTEGKTIIEKLEAAIEEANFGIVLATPDDEGHKAGHEDEKTYRARQNVVLEMGMLLAKLGRDKVAIVIKNQEKMEKPSDISGLIYIPFKEDLETEAGILLAKAMSAAGYNVNIKDL